MTLDRGIRIYMQVYLCTYIYIHLPKLKHIYIHILLRRNVAIVLHKDTRATNIAGLQFYIYAGIYK